MSIFPAKERFVINDSTFKEKYPKFSDNLFQHTGMSPIDFEMFTKGQGNIFRLDTSAGPLSLNILFVPGYPRKEQLEYVYSVLQKHSIDHPKLMYFDSSSELFPYGFMLHSWIKGVDSEHSGESWLNNIIEALAPLHGAKVDTFWSSTGLSYNSLSTYINNVFQEVEQSFGDSLLEQCHIVKLEEAQLIPRGTLKMIETRISTLANLITADVGEVSPCLLHGDPLPGNLILRDKEEPFWIDWSESRMGWWPFDLSRLLYYFKSKVIFETFIKKNALPDEVEAIARYVGFEHIRQDLRQLFLLGCRETEDRSDLQNKAQVILKRIHQRLEITLREQVDYEKLISVE